MKISGILFLMGLLGVSHMARAAVTVSGPPGLELLKIKPEEPLSPLYEQMPLKNRLDVRIAFTNGTGSALTFQQGTVKFPDAFGQLLDTVDVDSTTYAKRTTFSSGGTLFQLGQRLVNFSGHSDEQMTGLTLDNNGRLVAGGFGVNNGSGSYEFLLARLLPNGDLDDAFDGNGLAAGADGVAYAIAIQPDNRVLMAGRNVNDWFIVQRFDTNGTPDTSFAGGSIRLTQIGSYAEARAIALDSQNRIIVAGYSVDAGGHHFALVRYLTNGNLDASFGVNGIVVTDFLTAENEQCHAVAVDSNDRIVAAGWGSVGTELRLAMARYEAANGALDTSFSGDGKVLVTFSGADHVTAASIGIAASGRIIIGGRASVGGENRLALAGFTVDGVFDAGFGGGDGQVITDFVTTENEVINAITIDSTDRIVVAGVARDDESHYFALAQYTTGGALDAQFSGDGKLKTTFTDSTFAAAMGVAVLPGGDIVAGGAVKTEDESYFAFARYNANGTPDHSTGVPVNAIASLNLTDFDFFFDLETEPFDGFDPKSTPARLDVELKFAEFATPLSISGIEPVVFQQNERPYPFPMRQHPEASWYVSQGHEFGSNHESGQLQRFHYDISARDADGKSLRTGCDLAALQRKYSSHTNFDAKATYEAKDFPDCYYAYNELIYAIADGTVVFSRDGVPDNFPVKEKLDSPGGGNTVIIDHGDGIFSWYAHMAPGSVTVSTNPPNNQVTRGQPVGRLGNSGNSSGPHLHFGLLENFDGSSVENSQGVPIYFMNVFFKSDPGDDPMRQLRSGLLGGTYVTMIDAAPIPFNSPGLVYGPGHVGEVPDHDSIANPQRLALPVSVSGTVEKQLGRYLADGGDGIEDVYRFTVASSGTLSAQLNFQPGADLDMILYDQNLYAIQPWSAKSLARPEILCAPLNRGTYYLFISIYDTTSIRTPVPYQLDLAFATGSRDIHVDRGSLCQYPAGNLVCNLNYGGPYPTVNRGLNAVCPGDRMFIRVGSYPESVVFKTPMQVRSYDGTALINP